MKNRPDRSLRDRGSQRWPTPSAVLAGAALFIALGGSAIAADGLIQTRDIAPGAVTSKAIKNGAVQPHDLSKRTRALMRAGGGLVGAKGDTGSIGAPGGNGANGANGPNGANGANGLDGFDGTQGSNGTDGLNGTNGIDGTNGLAGKDGTNGLDGKVGANGLDGKDGTNGVDGNVGANGLDGTNGTNGLDGKDGTNGSDGANGTVAPLSATQGLTALPTGSPPTTVVELAVPAGNYVVLAKTQLSHTGAGDSVNCNLKAGATVIDQIAMKTLPALAAIPASMQAVTTTASATQLSVECKVLTANGAADFSSLIAIPTA